MNTGTWESFILSIANHAKLTKLRRSQIKPKLPTGRKAPNRGTLSYNKTLKKWCLLFPGPDGAVVSTVTTVCDILVLITKINICYTCACAEIVCLSKCHM